MLSAVKQLGSGAKFAIFTGDVEEGELPSLNVTLFSEIYSTGDTWLVNQTYVI
jgi:hypothetical protein